MDRTDDAIVEKILESIGKKVSFQYPGNEGRKEGFLEDRAVVPSNSGSIGVPYWDAVDLIKFPGEPEQEWIRIGYYRKRGERQSSREYFVVEAMIA